MDQELIDFLNRYINLTELRNREDYNPVMVTLTDPQDRSRELLMIASHYEPTFESVPYNVLWLVSNPQSLHYQKLFRRVSDAPSADFKYSWDAINSFSEIWTEDQYYDSVPQDLRDHGITSLSGFIGPASQINQGLTLLSDDDGDGVAVSNTDPRNSNSRYPNDHTHPDYPRTLIKVNDIQYGKFDQSIKPQPGMLPMLTELNPDNPLEWGIIWRYPVFKDIVQIDRSLVSIEIVGPAIVDEQSTTDYIIRATFADGAVRDVVPSRFYGDRNDISAVSGQSLEVFNTIQAETIVLKAEYTEDGVYAETELTVQVTLGVQLQSLRIQGPLVVNENGSGVYAFIATFTDGTEQAITPNQVQVDNLDLGNFTTQGVLATGDAVDGDKPLQLSARYVRDAIEVSATLDITVKDLDPYPTALAILGPQSLTEGESGDYVVRLTMSDGVIIDDIEPMEFTSSNTDTNISTFADQTLTVSSLTEDSSTQLTAVYRQYSREVSATLNVNFVNLPPVLTQAIITRPSEVEALFDRSIVMPQFYIDEQYDDGSGSEIPHGNKYDIVSTSTEPTLNGKEVRTGVFTAPSNSRDEEITLNITNLNGISPIAATAPFPFVIKAPRPSGLRIAQRLLGGTEAKGTYRFRLEATVGGSDQRFNWNDDVDSFIPPTFDINTGDYSTLPQRSYYVQMPADLLGVTIAAFDYTNIQNVTRRFIDISFPNDMGPDPFDYQINFVYVRQITLTDGSIEYATAINEMIFPYNPG